MRSSCRTPGNTHYKGIGEILDRKVPERRDRGGAVEELKFSNSVKIDQIRALPQLREGIWLDENPTDN